VESVAPDEAAVIAECIAFLEAVSRRRHPAGPLRRFNQGRHTACVSAEFTVSPDLAPDLRVGLFAEPRTYPAFVRFANASSASDRERDVRGMAVALDGVGGDNLTPGATRQDFVLNSHPVMAAPDTKEFLALLRALEGPGWRRIVYFATHPRAARIGYAARGQPSCHLDIAYWSTTPYLFGPGRAVKYLARPRSDRTSTMPSPLTDRYLEEAMRAHLARDEACFEFLVQFQRDARSMPIEDASVEWDVRESPFVPVARIRIPRQDVGSAESSRRCEESSFNPWHCLPDHRPLGNMNRARRDIYAAMSRLRALSRR
jgi:hypothetical protein